MSPRTLVDGMKQKARVIEVGGIAPAFFLRFTDALEFAFQITSALAASSRPSGSSFDWNMLDEVVGLHLTRWYSTRTPVILRQISVRFGLS